MFWNLVSCCTHISPIAQYFCIRLVPNSNKASPINIITGVTVIGPIYRSIVLRTPDAPRMSWAKEDIMIAPWS